MTMRNNLLLAAVIALAAGLAGCSQVAALAPVGGDALSEVRFAAIDVLLQKGVAVGQAPDCVATAAAIECSGTTVEGAAINVSSQRGADATLEVSVGGTSLFSGRLQDVLDAAARS